MPYPTESYAYRKSHECCLIATKGIPQEPVDSSIEYYF
jgi:hypothetical protein